MKIFMAQQIKAFNYAKDLSRIALFMEMRLGKTLVIIRWAEYNKRKRILVLAPCAVLPCWKEELQDERYADEDIKILNGSTLQKLEQAEEFKGQWILTNYETVTFGKRILKLDWDCIIIDESTKIKNPKPDITKFLNKGVEAISHRAILSGLPAPESLLDYFEQFRFLYGHFMHQRNYWWFRKRYFFQSFYDWEIKTGARELIKEEVAKLAFVMTAKEAGIGNKKIYEKRYVELNPLQKKIYKEIEKTFEYEDKDGNYIMTKFVPVKLGWMQRVCGGFSPKEEHLSDAKIIEINNLLKSELKNQSIVIWFKHTLEMESALLYLENRKYKCAFYNANKKEGEKDFKDGKKQIMLAQPMCGKYGLDWSVASTAIYYSNWWSTEVRAQTEKRIEHPKKKQPLLYIDLLCRKTIDVDVLSAVRSKHKTSKNFLESVLKSWRKRNDIRTR